MDPFHIDKINNQHITVLFLRKCLQNKKKKNWKISKLQAGHIQSADSDSSTFKEHHSSLNDLQKYVDNLVLESHNEKA